MPTLKICDFSSPVIIGGQHNWNLKVVRRREQRGNLCLLFAETLFVYSFDWEENADRESDADKAINQSMRALAIRIDSRLISRAKKVVLYTFSHSSTCGERVNRRVLVINRILQICGPPRLDLCARRVSSSHARSALRTTAAQCIQTNISSHWLKFLFDGRIEEAAAAAMRRRLSSRRSSRMSCKLVLQEQFYCAATTLSCAFSEIIRVCAQERVGLLREWSYMWRVI